MERPSTRNGFKKAIVQRDGWHDRSAFHDLRHCIVMRRALAGIPEELRSIAAGYSRGSVNQHYINSAGEQMFAGFAEKLGWNCPDVVPQKLKTADQFAN